MTQKKKNSSFGSHKNQPTLAPISERLVKERDLERGGGGGVEGRGGFLVVKGGGGAPRSDRALPTFRVSKKGGRGGRRKGSMEQKGKPTCSS